MAARKLSILSLGGSHLTVTTTSGGAGANVVLEAVIHQSIVGDPALKDNWVAEVESGLRVLALSTNLSEISDVVLPPWSVLSKLIKVAKVEGEGQREVVRFEVSNALPNGLDGLDWDYQILNEDDFERDVLVQAISSTLLSDLLAVLHRNGIRPRRVQTLVSAELHAMQCQYMGDSHASLLLDIGSRSVSLIIGAQGELPFVRSFGFGGSQVTQEMARQLQLSFSEAESLKLESVSSGSGGNFDALNVASEGFVSRLVSEVQRTLALYRRRGQPRNPERILLAGGASQLPGLADFLERKTGIQTSYYDPFCGITSGSNLSTSRTGRLSYLLPAPIGVAYAGEVAANLLSASAGLTRKVSESRVWSRVAASLVLIAGLVVGMKFHIAAWVTQNRISLMETELAPLESLVSRVEQEHARYTRQTVLVESKRDILNQRRQWGAILTDLQNRLNQVEDVWLESINQERPHSSAPIERLRVTGRLLDRQNPLSVVSANSRSRVEVLLASFENSPLIQSVEDRRFDTSRPGILSFDFSLIINPEASL